MDDLGQAIANRGLPGLSISARAGTAKYDYDHGAHERHHLWGVYLYWLLDKAVIRWTWCGKPRKFGFGPDLETGQSHCDGAIFGDRWRNFKVIKSLWNYYPDPELAAAMRALLDDKSLPSNQDAKSEPR